MDEDGRPIGYQVLAKGTPVVLVDGTPLGEVAKVLDNAREHIFDGIVVRTDDGRLFVDAPEVGRITDTRVTLTIGPGDVDGLPAYKGTWGVLEHGAQRRVDRLRRRLGGR